MKENLRIILTAIVTSGVIATVGMIYTHDKSLKTNKVFKERELSLKERQLDLNKEQLELERFKLNLPSKYDKYPNQSVKIETPVTDHLNNLDIQSKFESPLASKQSIYLDSVQNASIINLDLDKFSLAYTATETFQLAGLAICYFSTGLLICVLLLILNNAQINMTKNIKHKLKDIYRLSLDLSNKFIYLWMILLTLLDLFIGVFLILIY